MAEPTVHWNRKYQVWAVRHGLPWFVSSHDDFCQAKRKADEVGGYVEGGYVEQGDRHEANGSVHPG